MDILLTLGRWPAVAIAGFIIAGTGLELLPIAIVRAGALLALLVQIFQERRTGNSQFLTSPPFLLGAISLIFFSLIVGITDIPVTSVNIKDIESYFGSDAERMIVIFGLGCVVAHSLVAGGPGTAQGTVEDGPGRAGKDVYIFAAIALGVSLANVVNYISFKAGGPQVAALRSIVPPLLAFCLIYLVYRSARVSGAQKILTAVVIALSIIGLFYIQEGKKPLFIIVAALLYWLRLKNFSIAKLIVVGVTFALFAGALLQITQMIRAPLGSTARFGTASPANMFKDVLYAKFVMRQMETRYCFQSVIDKHWQQPFSASKQLFWLEGLVPRILWPEKPSLSRGRDYAPDYCGLRNGGPHSASITLLGQPVIQGGGAGLLLHGGILIVYLGGMGWLSRNPRSLSTVSVVALLPWLIDFDQDFAMYVANAVKFFLVMLPLIWLAARQKERLQIKPPSNGVV